MKFTLLEVAKAKLQSYNQVCAENNQRRAAAKKEIEATKAEEQALMNRQIEGEDLIDELAKAQAKIKVAEAKYQLLVKEIGEKEPEAKLNISFNSVKSEFNNYANGGLQEDMKEELETLRQAESQFLLATEKALTKFYILQDELRQQVLEAEMLFNQHATGALPTHFDESLLRSYGLWWYSNDGANVLYPVKQKSWENVKGPTPVFTGPKSNNPNFEEHVKGDILIKENERKQRNKDRYATGFMEN
jgi:predicted RNA-binding protein